MEDIRQTDGWKGYLQDKSWRVVPVKAADGKHKMNMFVIPLKLFGLTMMKLQRSEYDPDWEDLKKKKRRYKVVSSVIEPLRVQDNFGYRMAGYKLTRYPYLATTTYIIDLQQSKEKLWASLSENARRQIVKNKKTRIEECDQDTFYDLWRKHTRVWTMKKEEMGSLMKRFKGKAKLIVSKTEEGFHSGLLVIYSSDTANYYQTWTGDLGRKSGAHYKLVWEEILRAKKNRLRWFDLEGVYDERWPQKRWRGFSEFKRRFGGELVKLPGSYFRWL